MSEHPFFVIGQLAVACERRRLALRELEGTGAKQLTRESKRQLSQAEQQLSAAVAAVIAEDNQ